MTQPDFSIDPLRREVLDLFEANGAQGPVRYSTDASSDEVIFVLTTSGAAQMREAQLTRVLTELLHRKVWITTFSDVWAGRTAILE